MERGRFPPYMDIMSTFFCACTMTRRKSVFGEVKFPDVFVDVASSHLHNIPVNEETLQGQPEKTKHILSFCLRNRQSSWLFVGNWKTFKLPLRVKVQYNAAAYIQPIGFSWGQ